MVFDLSVLNRVYDKRVYYKQNVKFRVSLCVSVLIINRTDCLYNCLDLFDEICLRSKYTNAIIMNKTRVFSVAIANKWLRQCAFCPFS